MMKHVAPPTVTVDESDLLVKYLEEPTKDFINTACPSMISASVLHTDLVADPTKIAVIDIRTSGDFDTLGHIDGAVNVSLSNLLTYYRTNNLQSKTKVVLACYTGQTAGYGTALLRMAGYSNVFDLKFGMSSWNNRFAASWTNTVNNGNQLSTVNTTSYPKPAAGNLPVLNTGEKTGETILEKRINDLLAEGFTAKIPYSELKTGLLTDPAKYFIINYWSLDHYNLGHIEGAIQYTPKSTGTTTDLMSSAFLKTLPTGTDKTIVLYCYTGQTSAHVAAYLKSNWIQCKIITFWC